MNSINEHAYYAQPFDYQHYQQPQQYQQYYGPPNPYYYHNNNNGQQQQQIGEQAYTQDYYANVPPRPDTPPSPYYADYQHHHSHYEQPPPQYKQAQPQQYVYPLVHERPEGVPYGQYYGTEGTNGTNGTNDFEPDDECSLFKFDPKQMQINSMSLYLGARNTGKSTLLKDIMYHIQDQVRAMVVVCPTEESNHYYEENMNVPLEFIEPKLTEQVLEKCYRRQEVWAQHGPPPGYNASDKQFYFIWDDCLEEGHILRHDLIRRTFFNGRHFKVGLAFLVQYATAVPKGIRMQFDYIFVLKEVSHSVRRTLHEMFFGMFRTYEEFECYFDHYTDDYGCLVLNLKANSNHFRDRVFWYRADPKLANVKLTYPNSTMHRFHKYHYKPPTAEQKYDWNKFRDISSLPGFDDGTSGYGSRGIPSNRSRQQYKFVALDTKGRRLGQ